MIISAQQQANIVTPVTALGRTVVGNESLEAKATALPPVEEAAASDKTQVRPNTQAVLAKPDATLEASTLAAKLTSAASASGTVSDKASLNKENAEKNNIEQKSLAAIGRESLAKALDAAGVDPAVVSGDVSDQPIAAPNGSGSNGSGSNGSGSNNPTTQSDNGAINAEQFQGQSANQAQPRSRSAREQGQIAETGFTEEEIQLIQKLAARDREVRAHEQAHSAVGGDIAGSPTYTYKRGPDGVLYAVGGEVSISVSEVPNNPQATLRKAEKVQRAALAPAEPSAQDRRVAAIAARMAAEARAEIAAQIRESNSPNNQGSSVGGSDASGSNNRAIDGSSRPDSVYGSRPLNNSEYSNTGYTPGYVSERASLNLQDPELNEFYIASLNGQERQGQQVDFRV